MSQRNLRFSRLLLLASILFCCHEASAQKTTWRYLRTIFDGAKIYINDDFQTLSNKNVVVWDKRLAPDNSFVVSQV